jgi:hypothetical protein
MSKVFQPQKRKFTLRGADRDSFELQTRDLTDKKPLFSKPRRRGALARLLGAGGTHDTRRETDAYPYRRSWNRFTLILIVIILTWLLGFFIP